MDWRVLRPADGLPLDDSAGSVGQARELEESSQSGTLLHLCDGSSLLLPPLCRYHLLLGERPPRVHVTLYYCQLNHDKTPDIPVRVVLGSRPAKPNKPPKGISHRYSNAPGWCDGRCELVTDALGGLGVGGLLVGFAGRGCTEINLGLLECGAVQLQLQCKRQGKAGQGRAPCGQPWPRTGQWDRRNLWHA